MADSEAGAVRGQKWLFWTCFISLVATSFGFIVRAQIIGDWGADFNLSKTQQGEIFGVGLWPFAISIVLFSLIIDKIGYGRALVFAFVCHVASAIITIMANDYWMLYWGTFILALGNGTVEAVINPVVATIFTKDKTKWLNILHAGWPGGLVLGGLLALIMGPETSWKWKVGLILIPVAIYGVMLIRCKFPVQERVKAGVPYKSMLQEAGLIGAAIVVVIMIAEISRVFEWSLTVQIIVSAALILIYGAYVRSLGRPMFIFLLLIMVPLATTELGTDSWITELVQPVMVENLGLQAGWLLVYTAFIMMVLRFVAGPIVHRLSPLGLLAVSSMIAAVGLIALSEAAGIYIFLAATLYALGKTFFWPTMLGVAAEQFPRGGALTLNALGGMGMLSAGVIGAVFLGNIQDKQVDSDLKDQNAAIHARVIGEEKTSVFGKYQSIDQEKLKALNAAEAETVKDVSASAKKNALKTVAILPGIMFVCYLILIIYFRMRGGYKPVDLVSEGGPQTPEGRMKSGKYRAIRKKSLYIFIGFLSLSAVFAIVAVLSGHFGWFEERVLITTFTISACSVCCMACAAYAERRTQVALPVSAIFLSVFGSILIILGAWADIGKTDYWKLTVTVSTYAVACAHYCLLALANLKGKHRWIQVVTGVSIFLLATAISAAILGEISHEAYMKFIAVLSIIVALETLVIPILVRINKQVADGDKKLVLHEVEGGFFRDGSGRLFKVSVIDEEVDPHRT